MHPQWVLILGNTANPSLNFTLIQHKKYISNFSLRSRNFGNFGLFALETQVYITNTKLNNFVFTESKVTLTVLPSPHDSTCNSVTTFLI
jgi:hypothetical protein